jgi:Xaa-Pro aminopeptidase
MNAPVKVSSTIPFDTARLDRAMDEAGMDVLVVTSKHNVQYMLGGHRAMFFDYMDAMGVSRYLPVLVYPKGATDKAGYFGHRLENHQRELNPFWMAVQPCVSSGSLDPMQKAIDHVKKLGIKTKHIGVELGFMPMDAGDMLRTAFTDAKVTDAMFVLERMRAIKTPEELKKLKYASEAVIESMQAVIANHGPGTTKNELFEALRREEVKRGLTFEYCLMTAGSSLNRAPSDAVWNKGEIISLDSGGNYHGYIGDICRMAIHGEPDAELVDMLGEIEEIQREGFKPVKAGVLGKEMYVSAEARLAKSKYHNSLHFLAHGMGLVSHEAPRLTTTGPVPYDDYDAHRPLETGMVISVETTMQHPKRGFIKLEDTVVVTDAGFDIYGEGARGWNRGGTAL